MRSPPTLLDAKLAPAYSAGKVLQRPRLGLPESIRSGQATVGRISAPAGYGKSTLLAEWCHTLAEAQVRIAWLTLDEHDNDPSRFLRYVQGALIRAGILEPAGRDDDPAGSDTLPSLEWLSVQLASQPYRCCLVFDDAHVIVDEKVLGAIRWLAQYTPDNFQILLGGRHFSQLSLSRLRVRRKLADVDIDDLRFRFDEARDFLIQRGLDSLQDADVQQLLARTEGWPAGLEMASLVLEGAPDQAAAIRAFAGGTQNVVEYLGDVMLDTASEEQRRFILLIAQFRRINAELARRATGREDSQQLLDALFRNNTFLSRLDADGEWFRFHQLVREFLRRRGEAEEPELCRTALLNGARHFQAQGLPFEAIECALRAEAWETASALMAEHAEDLVLNQGYLQSMVRWMERLPQAWADKHPEIRVQYAFALTFFGRTREAGAHLQQLEATLNRLRETAPDAASTRALDCSISTQRCFLYALMDEPESAGREAESWLQKWPDGPLDQRAGVSNVLTFSYKCTGRLDEALALSDELLRWVPQQVSGHYVHSWLYVLRGYLLLKFGKYRQAQHVAEEALRVIGAKAARQDWLNNGFLHATLAMVHYEFGDSATAREHLEHCLVQDDSYNQADFLIIRYLTHARLLRQQGDAQGGFDMLHQGQQRCEQIGLARPALTLVAEQVVWLAQRGDVDDARALARIWSLDVPSDGGPLDLLADKRLRTATRCRREGQDNAVLAHLERGISHSEQQGLVLRETELRLLRARVWHESGNVDLATREMAKVLDNAGREGFFRLIDDEGAALEPLLRRMRPAELREEARAVLERLQQQRSPRTAAQPGRSRGLIEPLTDREMQILKRLRSDLSNREIAEALFVSEGTLKWHLHNIYGKLGVRNRAGAIALAAQLELI